MDISPLTTRHQGPIPCHEEHQLPEPSIDERTNDEKKHLAKLTFPSRDIRYHLLKTDSVKNHQKTRSRKTNSSLSSCEDNTMKIPDEHTPLKETINSTAAPSPSTTPATTTTTTTPTPLSPYPASRMKTIGKKESPRSPRYQKNKKTDLKKKIETKRSLPDIRNFWKKLDSEKEKKHPGNDISQEDINIRKKKMKEDPGRLDKDKFTFRNHNECTFDDKRTCMIHNCVADKISVKTSRYKPGVGFVQENIIQLRCSGGQRGLDTLQNFTGHTNDINSDSARCRTNPGDKMKGVKGRLALRPEDYCDWTEEETGCDVIGR